jgi:hypothetical protein
MIIKGVPELRILRDFEVSLMIIRRGGKDPPYMQNEKVYFLGSDKNFLLF